ncbi:MAG TPA: hypothetical protein VFQ54_12385, partial [Thermomicrobiales bacterium]|nr:hypothetical protein [Thermomicrobiales bacterium]
VTETSALTKATTRATITVALAQPSEDADPAAAAEGLEVTEQQAELGVGSESTMTARMDASSGRRHHPEA